MLCFERTPKMHMKSARTDYVHIHAGTMRENVLLSSGTIAEWMNESIVNQQFTTSGLHECMQRMNESIWYILVQIFLRDIHMNLSCYLVCASSIKYVEVETPSFLFYSKGQEITTEMNSRWTNNDVRKVPSKRLKFWLRTTWF